MSLSVPSSPLRSTGGHQRTPSATGLLGSLVAKSPLANLFSSPQLNYLPVPEDGVYNGESSKSGPAGINTHRVELKVGGMTVSHIHRMPYSTEWGRS